MTNEPITAHPASPSLRLTQIYGMAVIGLMAGLAAGYVFRGLQSHASPMEQVAIAKPQAPGGAMGGGHMPGLAEMKQVADKRAAPLLEKLKSDPNNGATLVQIGAIYHTTHQFKDAAAYYDKAAQLDPRNVGVRTKLAASLYRTGDVDGALAQLNRALTDDPKDADALFDLGMIRLQGKGDGKGALATWQRLLKSNPQLSADRKATVQRLMADVLTTLGDQHGIEGARSNDGHKSNSY
jgi:cytochrome c-type biogenesis protein CcmH/NrfG